MISIAAITAAAVMVCIRIHDYASESGINAAMIQNADSERGRAAPPIALENISDSYVLNRLIAQFAGLYLGVVPSADDLAERASARGALRLMSSPAAMAKWRAEILPDLESMANDKKMVAISVNPGDIRQMGDYFVVPFVQTVWAAPNDMAPPARIGGRELYLKLRFEKELRDAASGGGFDAGKFLDSGRPPAAIFKFMVEEAIIR
jgi:hypothetical protein